MDWRERWLRVYVGNTCRNRVKSLEYRYKKKMVWLDNPKGSHGKNPSIEIEDEFNSPTMELEKKERTMLIRKTIDSLPAEQKTVVVLRDIEGLSYEDIAQIASVNIGTIKSRLARVRLDLRDKLRSVISNEMYPG